VDGRSALHSNIGQGTQTACLSLTNNKVKRRPIHGCPEVPKVFNTGPGRASPVMGRAESRICILKTGQVGTGPVYHGSSWAGP